MGRERIGLSRRHRNSVYAAFGAAFVSGLAWIGTQLWLGDGGAFGESPSPLARGSMQVHGGAAMIVLVVLGTLLPGHVQRAWKARKSRRTGVTLLGLNAILIASGYALYYSGGEAVRAIVSPLHWIAGLGLPPLLAWHLWEARPRRARKARPRKASDRSRARSSEPISPAVSPPPGQPLH